VVTTENTRQFGVNGHAAINSLQLKTGEVVILHWTEENGPNNVTNKGNDA
jgi:hypothetical protein